MQKGIYSIGGIAHRPTRKANADGNHRNSSLFLLLHLGLRSTAYQSYARFKLWPKLNCWQVVAHFCNLIAASYGVTESKLSAAILTPTFNLAVVQASTGL